MALDALRSTFRRTTAPGDGVADGPPAAIPMWGPADSRDPGGEPADEPRAEYAPQPSEPFLPPVPASTGWALTSPATPAPIVPDLAAASTYEPSQFKPVYADPIAGGDTDTDVYPCPSCGRTIARGTRRCDGCGQRLLLDVPMRRAASLAGGGAAAGILASLLLVNLFAPARPAAAAGSIGDPAASGGSGSGTSGQLAIPTGAAAALKGTTEINGRLASEATPLAKALAAKSFKPGPVVLVLRRMAETTRAGAGMLRPMGAWASAADQQAALASFYATLDRQIQAGLSASVSSASAYKKAAKQVLSTLHDAPGLDASARALVSPSGLELPAVAFPAALR